MIGWKVACNIGGKEVIAEIASQPMALTSDGYYDGIVLMVYYEKKLKQITIGSNEELKVVEK